MKIHLSARFSRRDELRVYRDQLQESGHVVTSRWLDMGKIITDAAVGVRGKPEEARQFALEDLRDLVAAECVIAFTQMPRGVATRGGRHVEFGVAVALNIGIGVQHKLEFLKARRLIIVGPRENVFHCVPGVIQFPEWSPCLSHLRHVEDCGGSNAPKLG